MSRMGNCYFTMLYLCLRSLLFAQQDYSGTPVPRQVFLYVFLLCGVYIGVLGITMQVLPEVFVGFFLKELRSNMHFHCHCFVKLYI